MYDESVVGNGAYLLFIWLYKNNLLKWSDKVVAHWRAVFMVHMSNLILGTYICEVPSLGGPKIFGRYWYFQGMTLIYILYHKSWYRTDT